MGIHFGGMKVTRGMLAVAVILAACVAFPVDISHSEPVELVELAPVKSKTAPVQKPCLYSKASAEIRCFSAEQSWSDSRIDKGWQRTSGSEKESRQSKGGREKSKTTAEESNRESKERSERRKEGAKKGRKGGGEEESEGGKEGSEKAREESTKKRKKGSEEGNQERKEESKEEGKG